MIPSPSASLSRGAQFVVVGRARGGDPQADQIDGFEGLARCVLQYDPRESKGPPPGGVAATGGSRAFLPPLPDSTASQLSPQRPQRWGRKIHGPSYTGDGGPSQEKEPLKS